MKDKKSSQRLAMKQDKKINTFENKISERFDNLSKLIKKQTEELRILNMEMNRSPKRAKPDR